MKINDNEVAKRLKDAKQQLVKTISLKPLLNRTIRLHSGNPYSHYQNPEFGIIGLLECTYHREADNSVFPTPTNPVDGGALANGNRWLLSSLWLASEEPPSDFSGSFCHPREPCPLVAATLFVSCANLVRQSQQPYSSVTPTLSVSCTNLVCQSQQPCPSVTPTLFVSYTNLVRQLHRPYSSVARILSVSYTNLVRHSREGGNPVKLLRLSVAASSHQ